MEWSVKEELMAQAIGCEVLKQLKQEGFLERQSREAEDSALQMVEEIRRVLEDESAPDPECCRRIEAIVRIFESKGIYIARNEL